MRTGSGRPSEQGAHLDDLTPLADDSLLSLVTCYPFDAIEAGGPMRYVVTAQITPGAWPKPASHPLP